MKAAVLGLLTLAAGCGSGGGAGATNVDDGGRGGTGATFDGGLASHGTGGSAIGAGATGGAGTVSATGGRGTGGAQSGGASTGGKGSGFPGFGGRFAFGGFFGGMASGGRAASTGGVGPVAGSTGGSGATASPGTGGTVGMPGGGPSPSSALLPTAKEACPAIKTGNMMFLGSPVTIWAGTPTASQQGPVVIYWYATGSSPQEAVRGLGQAAITEIMNEGGVVAAPGATNQKGTNTGNGVWYTGDFETTDEVIACAIAQLHIDTRRIHAAGFSAGGLQTTRMSYDRSGYLASVVPYSGGITGFGAAAAQDPSNVPVAMVVHGAPGSDVVILDFAQASASYEADIKKRGGFSIDCNHGGGHMIPTGIAPSTWTFMKDHPFRGSPEPYAAAIPSSFPAYCKLP